MINNLSLLSLDKLPSAPAGKAGWPWIAEPPQFSQLRPDAAPWPRLSIVTISYNQAEFIETTIRSVLLQGYPNLEYIIIDGGSSDGSVEIIRKYEPWLTYWVSEPDRGQTHALNKGFQHATGEIMAYINSDDFYHPGVLHFAVEQLLSAQAGILIGCLDLIQIDQQQARFLKRESPREGTPLHFFPIFANRRNDLIRYMQPSSFWRSDVWQQTGSFDERYNYIMDREWFTRALAHGARVVTVEQPLANFTLHSGSKTQEYELRFLLERAQMYARLSHMPGFRYLPCQLDGLRWRLRYFQDKAYAQHEQAKTLGKTATAYYHLTIGRIFRRLRMGVDLLAGLQPEQAKN